MEKKPRHFVATVFCIDPRTRKMIFLFNRKLGMWLPPGGHMEPDETPDEAALREVKEETGFEIEIMNEPPQHAEEPSRVQMLHTPLCIQLEEIADREKGDHQHIDLIYAARITGGSLTNSEKHEVRWLSESELDSADLKPNVLFRAKLAFRAILESKRVP
ncbi:NUDIX domain-containing protein [Candidatus Micrarchaeota archaeon]|nr:NUDIX domain-containing protein [Candidatus Micrarchaeota archaeon]